MNMRPATRYNSMAIQVIVIWLCSVPGFAQYLGAAVALPPALAHGSEETSDSASAETVIAPGDTLSIETYGAPELTTSFQTVARSASPTGGAPTVQGIKVDPDGEITLPYLGSLNVAGMSASRAAAYLRVQLISDGILVEPQVSVRIVESPTRLITVIGEVIKPEPIPSIGRMRLFDAIAACGGFTPLASHELVIRHAGSATAITVELGTNPQAADVSNVRLLAGDTVIVPKVGNVFVVGYVKTPSAIPLAGNAPLTVLRALALAGGVNYGAGLSKARIIRTTPDNRQTIVRLDLGKIMFGKEQDVALLSNDVLLIPANAFKAGMAGGGAGVAAALLYGVSGTATALR